jgi:hypothetical protein
VFKLLEAAVGRWRAVNGPTWWRWCAPGPDSKKGKLVERPKEAPEDDINSRRVIMRGSAIHRI